ncbi:MAG: homoserine kinase [Fimbriimonadaceae bacterium]|nr:homoserine kinase [Fimbriimonadaceae bacterium]
MISVRLPATSANLGPGFDSMGLALDLWNTFDLNLLGEPGTVTVRTEGEGADWLPSDRTNLVAQTMIEETWPGTMPTDLGIEIVCRNCIPAASGMGSSSTATLAGLIFASALAARANNPSQVLPAVKDPLNLERVLARAVKLEGHGDNVAPALLGGLILVASNGSPITKSVSFTPMEVVICVPDFRFLTAEARAALPGEYSKADTIHNIGHSLLVLEALRTGNLGLLGRAMGDRIHEPFRMPLIPGAIQARQAAHEAGAVAACLSGAGPGMIAFADRAHEQIGLAMQRAFADSGLTARHWTLKTSEQGAKIGSD